MKTFWKLLRDQWEREGKEHPVLSKFLLFGLPVLGALYGLLKAIGGN
jgi:hypothetical protein